MDVRRMGLKITYVAEQVELFQRVLDYLRESSESGNQQSVFDDIRNSLNEVVSLAVRFECVCND